MELFISIIGALVAISVSILGAFLANKNSITLQTRKLKEDHYIQYMEALQYLAANNSGKTELAHYTTARNKLFLIASEDVIIKLLKYEEKGVGKDIDVSLHDKYLTALYKAIRDDLDLKNKDLPLLRLKKP